MAATCRFSDSHEGGHVLFSPDGRLVAAAAMYRLVVRDARTLEIVRVFACVDRIDMLEWSCDSKYVLCGLFARGLAQQFNQRALMKHVKRDQQAEWRQRARTEGMRSGGKAKDFKQNKLIKHRVAGKNMGEGLGVHG